MKKIALTSVLAVFAATGANAANVIDGNPLYRPTLKHFASITTLTTGENSYANPRLAYGYDLTEDFMYGFTDHFALGVETTVSYDTDNANGSDLDHAHQLSLENVYVNGSYRFMDVCAFKADVLASVGREFVMNDGLHTMATVWGLGVKAGLDLGDFTIAGTIGVHDIDMNVRLAEKGWLAWGIDAEMWTLSAEVEAQYVINEDFNVVAGAKYMFDVSHDGYFEDLQQMNNPLVGKAGVNYNFDETKYVGAYATYDVNAEHQSKAWGVSVRFGIDF
ncbi:MAG: hypothetical protein KBS86_03360 [Proteobacteria bacterium]|nr:hypothetical protein [Candidatus Enterousia scatequi]